MSLSEIIETILLLNETSGRTEVKLCKHCGKPFVAKNIKAEYDYIIGVDDGIKIKEKMIENVKDYIKNPKSN